MVSSIIIYLPRFLKVDLSLVNVIRNSTNVQTLRDQGEFTSVLSFLFKVRKSRQKRKAKTETETKFSGVQQATEGR
jgi:hypothetical protein